FKPSLCKSEAPSLLYVGRMPSKAGNLREKSPWILLEIMANLVKTMPKVEMRLIGDGPGISSLKERAKELGIERKVVFSGYIDNSQLPPLYSRSWITFIPMELDSLDPFWDGSLKESLSCSTPVIGFNRNARNPSNGVPNIGYLIPPDSIEGAKILKILLSDKASLQKAGEIGRKAVSSCCSWDSVIERLESIYNSLF
ncbi:MAG: glycosyltransferase, partial [Candidatus Methanomethylicus sp.]|nr:glycosyltransferase [Candidatus Methanomethylicus sp.]